MESPTPETLGHYVARKRGSMGIRAAAKEIGISPATLSRIENGHVPDLSTLTKVCDWLGVDPGVVLGGTGARVARQIPPTAQIAFKKDQTVAPALATALANLILHAHSAFSEQIEAEGH